MTIKPTIKEIHEYWMESDAGASTEDGDTFNVVHESSDASWRHGSYMCTVFKRISDETFWKLNYQKSGDGEYNSFRDGDCNESDITQVYPKRVTTIKYVTTKPQ